MTSRYRALLLRQAYRDHSDMVFHLLNHWPSLPQYFVSTEFGSVVSRPAPLGLVEIITVLRRMYAYEPAYMEFEGFTKDNLLRLSCLYLEDVKPNDLVYTKTLTQFRWDSRPSFATILKHYDLEEIWNAPEMRVFQEKSAVKAMVGKREQSGQSWYTQPQLISRRDDMFIFEGNTTIQKYFDDFFYTGKGSIISCCNFPPFIRVEYITHEPPTGHLYPRFQDIRCVSIKAHTLQEEQRMGIIDVFSGPILLVQTYSLIACVFERDDQDKNPTVRTYSLQGDPILPRSSDKGDSEKRIGMPNTVCFLFYAKCNKNDQQNPGAEINSFTEAVDIAAAALYTSLQQEDTASGGTPENTAELPNPFNMEDPLVVAENIMMEDPYGGFTNPAFLMEFLDAE